MINLSGEWISSFIQNNKIYNEKVNFIQEGNNVKADILLNYDGEICNYEFSGIITKNKINGTYFYKEDSNVKFITYVSRCIHNRYRYIF